MSWLKLNKICFGVTDINMESTSSSCGTTARNGSPKNDNLSLKKALGLTSAHDMHATSRQTPVKDRNADAGNGSPKNVSVMPTPFRWSSRAHDMLQTPVKDRNAGWLNSFITKSAIEKAKSSSGPTTYTYTREHFGSGSFKNESSGKNGKAHSGRFLSGAIPSGAIKNYGQTPTGRYEVKTVRDDGIRKCDIAPVGHDALGRTSLQVHEPTTSKWRAAIHADSMGCIVTKSAVDLKVGDKVIVKDHDFKPDFSWTYQPKW